jgi:hypothetical protein
VAQRFFVTIAARDSRDFQELGEFGLDLFVGTAKRREEMGGTIEGLLSMAEVEKLVKAGFEVTVHEEASKRSRAREIISFEEWIKEV